MIEYPILSGGINKTKNNNMEISNMMAIKLKLEMGLSLLLKKS
jgi:hypothetical protein